MFAVSREGRVLLRQSYGDGTLKNNTIPRNTTCHTIYFRHDMALVGGVIDWRH